MVVMPQFPLFKWAARHPVFVIDDEVWLAARPRGERRNIGSYRCDDGELPLTMVQPIVAMGREYCAWNTDAIDLSVVSWRGGGCVGRRELCSASHRLGATTFVLDRLLPAVRRRGGEDSEAPTVSCDALYGLKSEIDRELESTPSEPDLSAAICSLPSVTAWGIVDECVCELVETEAPMGDEVLSGKTVVIPRRAFDIRHTTIALAELAAAFHEALIGSLRASATQRAPERAELLDRARTALSSVESCFATGRRCSRGIVVYDSPTWRIIRSDEGQWFLGLRVEPYVMQDRSGWFYRFDETVVLSLVEAGPYFQLEAQVERAHYDNPFISASGITICMGDYWDTLGKQISALPYEERLMQFVWDARQVLMCGYHQHNPLSPYRSLTEFKHRAISAETAAELNLPVYPFYRGQQT